MRCAILVPVWGLRSVRPSVAIARLSAGLSRRYALALSWAAHQPRVTERIMRSCGSSDLRGSTRISEARSDEIIPFLTTMPRPRARDPWAGGDVLNLIGRGVSRSSRGEDMRRVAPACSRLPSIASRLKHNLN